LSFTATRRGLDLAWSTLKYFIDRYRHLDLLLNLPVAGVIRAVAAGYETKAISMLGHEHPRELTDDTKGTKVRDWYHRQLANEGFASGSLLRRERKAAKDSAGECRRSVGALGCSRCPRLGSLRDSPGLNQAPSRLAGRVLNNVA
jgi:hypothetical protein